MTADILKDIAFTGPDLRASNGRGYTHPITGVIVPGVTTISGLMDKPHLVPWAAKLAAKWAADNIDLLAPLDYEARVGAIVGAAEAARHEARDIGSLAHWVIETWNGDEATIVLAEVKHQFFAWHEWRLAFVEDFIHEEFTVWSHTHGYAGTGDALVRLKDGRLALIDYKTGKDVYPEAGMQLWALRNADCIVTTDGEQPLPAVDVAAVVHLPMQQLTPLGKVSTKSNWSMREIETTEWEGRAFLALLEAWTWEHQRAGHVIGGKRTSL